MKKSIYLLGISAILLLAFSLQGSVKAASSNASLHTSFAPVQVSVEATNLNAPIHKPFTPAQTSMADNNASGCQAQGALPDPTCTPGNTFANVTADQVCTPGYSRGVRNVPQSEKDQVYANYDIASHSPGQYEVDHFIPLELGGSNDISNLWPEPAAPQPGFHQKDRVENYLHGQVCSGAMTLSNAQSEISTNWLNVYNNLP